jgi:hypothetical protein
VTVSELLARNEARIAYDRARRAHLTALLKGTDKPLMHRLALQRLQRYGPSETIVVTEIG